MELEAAAAEDLAGGNRNGERLPVQGKVAAHPDLLASMWLMTGTLGSCDRDGIRACTQLLCWRWRSARNPDGLAGGKPRRSVPLDGQRGRRGTAGFAGDLQLRVDVGQVPLDSPDAQAQVAGDRLIRQALRHQPEHLELT